ncbi:hypothetical protein [Collimonas sp. OK607]|uniref:hypothetical protein n=1 Tax=Collimonas sp. OK607 TaxID=1798194 RepID=UPI000B82FBFF
MHVGSERFAIIGADNSGVICTKVFRQQGIEMECFEKGSGLGGLRCFENDNDVGGCYRSLHINTSKRVMELSDYPIPSGTPVNEDHHVPLAFTGTPHKVNVTLKKYSRKPEKVFRKHKRRFQQKPNAH